MFTIKIVDDLNATESLDYVKAVTYYAPTSICKPQGLTDGGLMLTYKDDTIMYHGHPKSVKPDPTDVRRVFVMNENGKTVATYTL